MLTHLDLCSGVGAGFPYTAIALSGFSLVGLCERDEWCQDILRLRYPNCHIERDIKTLNYDRYKGRIDIITASPPCQPFSIRGKRLGAADERDCFPALSRAIAFLQPRYFCIENVPGLLNCPYRPGHKHKYFPHLLRQFTQLGYDAEWLCVGSGHFGAPFLRRRLLLVGVAHSTIRHTRTPTPWTLQVRESIERVRANRERAGITTGFPTQFLQSPKNLPRPLGTENGNSTTRRQRSCVGNILDPRVAAVALRRVLYLSRLSDSVN